MSSKSQYPRSRLAKIEGGKIIPPGVQEIMDLVTKTSILLGIDTDPPGKVLAMKRETWMLVAVSHAANRICILEQAVLQLQEKVEKLETRQMPETYNEVLRVGPGPEDDLEVQDPDEPLTPELEDRLIAQDQQQGKMCAFCKVKPVAYDGAIYCGAACCARAEAAKKSEGA